MADIAELGFSADTQPLKDAKKSLDALPGSAAKAEKAVDDLGKGLTKASVAAGKGSSANATWGTYAERAARAATAQAGATAKATAAADANASATGKAASGTHVWGTYAERAARAATLQAAANERVAATATAVAGAQSEAAATTAAVAAAQTEAIATGNALAAANGRVAESSAVAAASSRGMGIASVIAGGLALAAVAAIGVAAAAAGVVFVGAWIDIRKSIGDTTDGLGLTEKQLERLKAKGVDTSVTLGDAWEGLGFAIKNAMVNAFSTGGPLETWKNTMVSVWGSVLEVAINVLDTMVKTTLGTFEAIVAIWDDIPGMLGDIFMQAVNAPIQAYNMIVQAGWDFFYAIVNILNGIPDAIWNAFMGGVTLAGKAMVSLGTMVEDAYNWIVNTWRQWPQMLGKLFWDAMKAAFDAIVWLFNKSVEAVKSLWSGAKALLFGEVPTFTNSFAGKAAAGATKAGKAFDEAGTKYDKFKAKFKADFASGTADARKTRLTKAGGAPGKPKAAPKATGKTDAEKFADLVTGANGDIAKETARAAATDLSAVAAATLTEKTKLLNEANQKGIKLTDAMRGKIDELAAAYGKAKVAADNAVGLRDVLKTGAADLANLQSQIDLVGLYGRALAFATEKAKLLAEAKAKGMTPDAISAAMPQIDAAAGKVADTSAAVDAAKFMEGQKRATDERMRQLEEERSYIGLNADETNRLRTENEFLAAARRANIDLTPEMIATLKGEADAQADLENRLRKTKEAYDFAHDTLTGFFTDLSSNLQAGKSLWESFADAANKALQKIIDKILSKLFEKAVDALLSLIPAFGSGGSFGSSGGGGSGGFDFLHLFANGGSFTNGIYDTPTLFSFARGTALGEMGEAGPEAVMPLQRGPDGSLGVQMYGGGGGGGSQTNQVNVNNHYTLTGAISSKDIVDLTKASAEKTKSDIKRTIVPWLAQYQNDGVLL